MKKTQWILVGFVLLLLSIVFVVLKTPSSYLQQAEYLGVYLQSAGEFGLVAMVLLASLGIAVGLPRQLFAFVFGFAYGTMVGFLAAVLSAIAGCVVTYTLVRYLLSVRFRHRYPDTKAKLTAWVKEDIFLKIVILRFQPLGTNLISNVCAGLVPVPAITFFAGSAIGFIPQSLVFSMLGSGVRLGSAVQMWISLVLLLISVVLALLVYKRAV
ncbi:MAG: VTT domain-containing protein [Granulosicoccaceae bacterium]